MQGRDANKGGTLAGSVRHVVNVRRKGTTRGACAAHIYWCYIHEMIATFLDHFSARASLVNVHMIHRRTICPRPHLLVETLSSAPHTPEVGGTFPPCSKSFQTPFQQHVMLSCNISRLGPCLTEEPLDLQC